MRANDLERMDVRLSNWIATLIAQNKDLHDPARLRSFMGWIAEEDITTILQLTELYTAWREDYNSLR